MANDTDRKREQPAPKDLHGLSANEHDVPDRMGGTPDYDPDDAVEPAAEQDQIEAERFRDEPDVANEIDDADKDNERLKARTPASPEQR